MKGRPVSKAIEGPVKKRLAETEHVKVTSMNPSETKLAEHGDSSANTAA
ncbi:MAG: hypothetical protein QXG97_06690 [Nitrososphaerota archaeon]